MTINKKFGAFWHVNKLIDIGFGLLKFKVQILTVERKFAQVPFMVECAHNLALIPNASRSHL